MAGKECCTAAEFAFHPPFTRHSAVCLLGRCPRSARLRYGCCIWLYRRPAIGHLGRWHTHSLSHTLTPTHSLSHTPGARQLRHLQHPHCRFGAVSAPLARAGMLSLRHVPRQPAPAGSRHSTHWAAPPRCDCWCTFCRRTAGPVICRTAGACAAIAVTALDPAPSHRRLRLHSFVPTPTPSTARPLATRARAGCFSALARARCCGCKRLTFACVGEACRPLGHPVSTSFRSGRSLRSISPTPTVCSACTRASGRGKPSRSRPPSLPGTSRTPRGGVHTRTIGFVHLQVRGAVRARVRRHARDAGATAMLARPVACLGPLFVQLDRPCVE